MSKTYTDKELLKGCLRNSRKHQEALYRKFCPQMIRLGYRFTQDQEKLIEWVNNGFVNVFFKVDQFQNQSNGSFGGWIRTVVYHAIIDGVRKEKKYWNKVFFNEGYQLNGSVSLPTDMLQFEDLKRLTNSLKGKSKRVFQLYVFEGFSHKEIANELNISEGTSKWHLHTARNELQLKISNSKEQYR